MKTFNEFYNLKIQEQFGGKPAIKVNFQNLNFGYRRPVYVKPFSPDDPPDVSHSELQNGSYSGNVEIPIHGDAKDAAAKNNMNLKEFIDHVVHLNNEDELYQKFVDDSHLHLYDIYNAEFDGKLPSTEEIPEGLYEAINENILDKLLNNQYEVIYAW